MKTKKINDWQIKTPDGFVDFDGISLNGIKDIYEYKGLKGSDNHIILDDGKEKELKDIGIPLNIKEKVYDILDVKSENHYYYTNGLISHNCDFRGSTDSLLTSTTLQSMVYSDPVKTMYEGKLKIFKEVVEDRKYVMSIDTAMGVGQDYSTIQVIDVTDKIMEQVAVYRHNLIETSLFPYVIDKVGMMYNEAVALVENNSIGEAIVNELFGHIEYPELYSDDKHIGIRTTVSSKLNGVAAIKDIIENGGIIINDIDTVQEFSNFVRKGNTWKAEDGSNDDLVMALVVFGFFTTLDYFKEFCELDHRQSLFKKKIGQIEEEELMPVFLVEDDDISSSDGSKVVDDGFRPIR